MPQLDDKTIKELDQLRQQRMWLIRENTAYVKGNNPETLNEEPTKKPDNRITIPLGKMAVDTMTGFVGDIDLSWDNITTEKPENEDFADDKYITLRKAIGIFNEEELETMQLYEDALTQGVSYELFWTSVDDDKPGNITPEYKNIPNDEIALIWSSDIKRKLEAALRFSLVGKDHFLDVYYPEKSERWDKLKGKNTWIRNKEGDTVYLYKEVPLAIYRINRDQESFFQSTKGMIDANDKMLNKSVNEVDRFNAMIALFPQLVSKDMADKLVEMKLIDDLEQFEKWPQYLQKNLTGVNEFYGMVTKQVEKWFFQTLGIINLSDESIQGIESGEALRRKMLAMEFVASKIDMYFKKGLIMRNNLINDVLAENNNIKPEDYTMTIKITRNIPVDEASKIDSAVKVFGTISKKAYLEALPKSIIPDVQKELALEESQEDDVDLDNLVIDEE